MSEATQAWRTTNGENKMLCTSNVRSNYTLLDQSLEAQPPI